MSARLHRVRASVAVVLIVATSSWAASAGAACGGNRTARSDAPAPADPYPLKAAGWGPEAGGGLQASRWAEDWTGMRPAGRAPRFKAIPIGGAATLTLSGELRLRYDVHDEPLLVRGNDYEQGLLRTIAGADLRLNPNVRLFTEIGIGHVDSRQSAAPANFENDASLQQAFIDARGWAGSSLVGVMAGRQEFVDGPRQLISLSDGPNLHRVFTGVRFYLHGPRARAGAFAFRPTRHVAGAFDERTNDDERMHGVNASFVLSPDCSGEAWLDPFWIHTENERFRSGGQTGRDERDTIGARLWGRRGRMRYDWTFAWQTGRFNGRDVDAWGAFAIQSLVLSDRGWRPRITSRIDAATGGGSYSSGTLKRFNQLYASSSYLGDGQYLSLSNLFIAAPGIALAPTKQSTLSIEYGFAWRLAERDAAYAAGMRPYAGTQSVPGHELGRLLRMSATWSVAAYTTLSAGFEHFTAGEVLDRAGFPSGSYGYAGVTMRY